MELGVGSRDRGRADVRMQGWVDARTQGAGRHDDAGCGQTRGRRGQADVRTQGAGRCEDVRGGQTQ